MEANNTKGNEMAANYDMAGMRKELITALAKSLRKDSKFYREDYEAIVSGVGRKTRKELIESLNRQRAINGVSKSEIRDHCQV